MQQKDNRHYIRWGMTALCVIFASILLVVIFTNLPGFFDMLSDLGKILSPLVSGVVIAFLLNPLVAVVDKRLAPLLKKSKMKRSSAERLSRLISVLFSLAVAALIVYAFFSMLLPQLYESVMSIVDAAPGYYQRAEEWVLNVMEDNPEIQTYVNTGFDAVFQFVENWLKTTFLSDVQKILTTLTTSVMAVITAVTNFIIGFVASIYILFSKETFQAQSKKLIAAILPEKAADRLLHVGRETYRVFNGFVIGKIIDSAIIGVLCYIGMAVLKLPYPALLSTIVGITNVIPVFGPAIGMIPGAVIILLINPLQAFYFIVFVIVLQQIDGNVIGPKILGNTVGISGFWVLASITIAASLFGFAGMLLGVPVFAIIYMLISEAVNAKLEKKHMPTETDAYYGIRRVNELHSQEDDSETVLPPEPAQAEQEAEQKETV